MVDGVALVDGDEEELAFAGSPGGEEILRCEEDRWGVGEGGAEEHGGGATIDERDLASEVEGDRRAVGLIAIEEDFIVARDGMIGFELFNGVGEGLRGEHGGEASEGDVGGDEKDRRRDCDGRGGGEMSALGAEEPRDRWTEAECQRCKRGGKTESGEAGAGEVEEAGHREGVVADAAVGEKVADVRHEGEVARCPEAVGECDCDRNAQDGEDAVSSGD